MGAGEWISAIATVAGFVGWMTAMWVRAGRILQRIDDIAGEQVVLRQEVAGHETRLTRLEVVTERSRP
jgi:hypothetical protein